MVRDVSDSIHGLSNMNVSGVMVVTFSSFAAGAKRTPPLSRHKGRSSTRRCSQRSRSRVPERRVVLLVSNTLRIRIGSLALQSIRPTEIKQAFARQSSLASTAAEHRQFTCQGTNDAQVSFQDRRGIAVYGEHNSTTFQQRQSGTENDTRIWIRGFFASRDSKTCGDRAAAAQTSVRHWRSASLAARSTGN